jgi:centromere protein C
VEVEEVPEKGWDDQTKPHGVILDYTTGKETTKRDYSHTFCPYRDICTDSMITTVLAVPADMVEFKDVPGAPFKFQKIFGDSDFIAAGMVSIPVGGQKPSKPTKDNTYVGFTRFVIRITH